MNDARVKHDALDTMFAFLHMGGQRSDPGTVEYLKGQCALLERAMTQKTAGQSPYKKAGDVNWHEVDAIINAIVIGTLALHLSGDLDKLLNILQKEGENNGQAD